MNADFCIAGPTPTVLLSRGFLPVQTPVLNGFADVSRREIWVGLKIGNSAGDLEDSVIRPGRKAQPSDRLAQQGLHRIAQVAIAPEVPSCHMCVGVEAGLAPKAADESPITRMRTSELSARVRGRTE